MGDPGTEQAWLDNVRAALLRGDQVAARTALARGIAEFPDSIELRRIQAALLEQAQRHAEADAAFQSLLDDNPADAISALALGRIRVQDDRTASAGELMRACFSDPRAAGNAELAIAAIEMLDDCDRKHDAAAIARAAIGAHPDDARLHAYAGMLAVQLGEFDTARRHFLFALEHDERAWGWHVAIGLSSAQRYADAGHPDFARFRAGLERAGLSDLARAELHFALGKAHDDIGGYPDAAHHLREGNAIRNRLTTWSRKAWRRTVEARLAARPFAATAAATPDFTPVFIVGMPRTGTTLLAGRLSRHRQVCNRGELAWLAQLALRPELTGTPERAVLQTAAAEYAGHVRRDDAGDARWFIDKQPLNFRYVDLALALFPDARVIHCVRNPRDTAFSLWMQCFLEDVQGYSYDFDDIAQAMRDEQRLMAHWLARYPDSIRSIGYADLVADPDTTVAALARWLEFAPGDTAERAPDATAISTASLWQARQPVHTRSIGRWTHYATLVPELSRFSTD